MKNVIVLTSGLSGSSVLASLLVTAGFWPGIQTHKKKDYDTFENTELVRLNKKLIDAMPLKFNYTTEFDPEILNRMESIYQEIDIQEFRSFIEDCNRHAPWIWKDPRLWFTIRFWKHLIDLEKCCFVLLSRDPLQNWISTTLRKQIQSYKYSIAYNKFVYDTIIDFFKTEMADFMEIQYETLIVNPENSLDRLNQFLDISLTTKELSNIYKGSLYKKPKTWFDMVKASLIYAKNFSYRKK
jgi:hypothetical protein